VAPSGVPATLPPSSQAPILAALDQPPHVGLTSDAQRVTILAWLATGTAQTRNGVHDPSFADPRSAAFHGAVLRASRWTAMLDGSAEGTCGRCHEGAPSRPAGVTEPAPGAPACTSCHDQPGGVLACGTCHGDGARAYPPRSSCFFPADAPAGGVHAAHVGPSPLRSTGLACTTCHPTPGDPVIAGAHGNGSVEIVFDPAVVTGEASYDRTTKTCAVSCHDRGGARARLTWNDDSSVGCNDCHRSPPAGHHPGPCDRCHAEANAEGTALMGGALHLNGTVDLGDGSGKCGACHGSGDSPWPSTAAHPAHRAPTSTEPIACATCHVVPTAILDPTHLDGTVRVTLSGLAAARGAEPSWDGQACADVACHGANLADPAAAPQWSDSSGSASHCGACHGIPPSQHTPSTDCGRSDCHGSEVSLDVTGAPSITSLGLSLHVDGIVESNR
jgi:predicted CxxxxCH...CXXCH cytochrome family protein